MKNREILIKIFSNEEHINMYNDILDELDQITGCLTEDRALKMDDIDEYLGNMKISDFLSRLDYEHFYWTDEYFYITSTGIYSSDERDYTNCGYGIEYMIDEIADHANEISTLDIDIRDMFQNLDRDFYDPDALTSISYIEEIYL